jgi:hypothetical protein
MAVGGVVGLLSVVTGTFSTFAIAPSIFGLVSQSLKIYDGQFRVARIDAPQTARSAVPLSDDFVRPEAERAARPPLGSSCMSGVSAADPRV